MSVAKTTSEMPVRLTEAEIQSLVCKLLCKGLKPSEIAAEMNRRLPGLGMTREAPYQIVSQAARQGWLMFRPPQHEGFRERLRQKHPWLDGVEVSRNAAVEGVADAAARELLRLIRAEHCRGAQTVHVGVAGGHSMRALARSLATLLKEPTADLPDKIVFHALASGFDAEDPTTDPNAFFTFFLGDALLRVERSFRGLAAPSMVGSKLMDQLKKLGDIRSAFESVKDLNIIVTSGSNWTDEHCALRRRMAESPRSRKALEDAACRGDMLWRPLADDGPIEVETELRAFTLIELGQLPGLIAQGTRVLLMLAPCGACHQPKGDLLRSILNQKQPLVTSLVADSLSVGQLLDNDAEV